MSTTSDSHERVKLFNECRFSDLTDRQWCIQNGSLSVHFIIMSGLCVKKPVSFLNRRELLHRNRKLFRSRLGKQKRRHWILFR